MIVQTRRNVIKLGGSWLCICDYCNAECTKAGIEAGDAAEAAFKVGWQTVGATARIPAKWLCWDCTQKQANKAKNGVVIPTQ